MGLVRGSANGAELEVSGGKLYASATVPAWSCDLCGKFSYYELRDLPPRTTFDDFCSALANLSGYLSPPSGWHCLHVGRGEAAYLCGDCVAPHLSLVQDHDTRVAASLRELVSRIRAKSEGDRG